MYHDDIQSPVLQTERTVNVEMKDPIYFVPRDKYDGEKHEICRQACRMLLFSIKLTKSQPTNNRVTV